MQKYGFYALALAMAVFAAGMAFSQDKPVCKEDYGETMNQYSAAMKFISQKKFKEAIPPLLCMQEYYDKKWGEGWALIGDCYAQAGDAKTANTAYRNADKLGFASATMLSNWEQVLIKLGDAEGAKAVQEKAKTAKISDADKAALTGSRCQTFFGQRQYGEAAACYEEAYKLEKTGENAYMAGSCYHLAKNYEKAVALLKAALPSGYQKEDTLKRLANLSIDLGRETNKASYFDDAANYAQQLVGMKGSDAAYQRLLGEALLGAKKFADAAKALEKAASLDARHCLTKHNLGRAYSFDKQYDKAIAALQDASRCDAKSHLVLVDLANTYIKKFEAGGSKDGALLKASMDACDRAAKLKAGAGAAIKTRAEALLANMDIDAAERQAAERQRRFAEAKAAIMPKVKIVEGRRETATVGGKLIGMVFATAKNESDTLLDATVSVDFLDASGKSLKTVTAQVKGIKPGAGRAFSVEAEGMEKAANYRAKVTDINFEFKG